MRKSIVVAVVLSVWAGALMAASPAAATYAGSNGLIVFVRGDDQGVEGPGIYTMNTLGCQRTQLTSEVGRVPVWSPDGSHIYFQGLGSDPRGFGYVIHNVMAADGSNLHEIGVDTDPASFDLEAAQWSPDSTKLTFARVMDINQRPNAQTSELFVANADGTGLTRLTNDSARDSMPAWSRDGTKLAYINASWVPGQFDTNTNAELWVMDATGANPRRLTTNAVVDQDPQWSPTQDLIAFRSPRDGSHDLFVIDPATGVETQLTNEPGDLPIRYFEWAPDGSHLLYDYKAELYTVLPDGTGRTKIPTKIQVSTAHISPDMTRIVYDDQRGGITLINADGSGHRRLTETSGNIGCCGGADWQAVPGGLLPDTTPPSLTGVRNEPDPFNPDKGEATRIHFTPSEDVLLTVTIRKAGQVVSKIMKDEIFCTSGSVFVLWTGRKKPVGNSKTVDAGKYTWELIAEDDAGNRDRVTGKVTVKRN